jgi:hypothetical protein
VKKILKRLNERSTWAGLGALAILFGVDAAKANIVVEGVAGLLAAAAVFMPDGAVVKQGE